MSYSIYDLYYGFIKYFYNEITEDEKNKVCHLIKGEIKNGTTSNEIIQAIKSFNGTYRSPNDVIKAIKTTKGNLLKDTNRIYFHNELRLGPKAPIKEIDINTGKIVKIKQEYYLEMKCSYTIEELFNYIKSKQAYILACKDQKRIIGTLKYLIEKIDIEKILYMIDISNNILVKENRIAKNIIGITDYQIEAEKFYNARKSEAYVNGDYKLVFKKREPFKIGEENVYK